MVQITNKPTLEQVAQRCNVSCMTVSRALRSDASVSEDTRRMILKVAEELGYHPRARMGRPRHVKKDARGCIEVIVGATLHSTFYSGVLTAIERELADRKYDCVIRTANGDYEEFMKLCDLLRMSQNTPTMMVGYLPFRQLRTLLEVRPNTLLVDHTGDPRLDIPYSSIGFDNTEAARMVIRHLISTGRKRILLLTGFADHYFTREIVHGYRDTLTQMSLSIDEELIIETDFTIENAVRKLQNVLDTGMPIDAVFTNDEMATGVLYTLNKRGLNVPHDVAVAGCDGLSFSRYLLPPLTTVLLDHDQLGRMAVEYILDRNGKTKSICRTRMLPCLEVRESTAKKNSK